ncbi:hypothetical protein ACT1U9_17480 [Streptomyces sp. BR1]|uniref:hypothetical protein n=1 Tax=Streptomyces sp. BR1 TaxID=1592323 RepID=UPI00402BEB92
MHVDAQMTFIADGNGQDDALASERFERALPEKAFPFWMRRAGSGGSLIRIRARKPVFDSP